MIPEQASPKLGADSPVNNNQRMLEAVRYVHACEIVKQDRQMHAQDSRLLVRSIFECMCDEQIVSWRRDRRMQLKLVALWRRASDYGTAECTTRVVEARQ